MNKQKQTKKFIIMIVTELKTSIVPISEVETTCNIVNAFDLGESLFFTTANSFSKRCLSLMSIEYGEVGFERKSDWMRFVNKLNSYNKTPIKRMITSDKKSLDWGGAIIKREDIEYTEDGFLVEFKQPIPLVIEQIGDNYLMAEVTQLKGKTTWEWYSRSKGHEDLENICGICEIFIYDVEIVK